MNRETLAITRFPRKDQYLVRFYTGQTRTYGNLATLLNVISDYYATNKYLSRRKRPDEAKP